VIREDTTVSDAVRRYPNLSRFFEQVGVNYCCGGNVPIADACAEKGLDAATVVTMINAQLEVPAQTAERLDTLSTTELVDHIVSTHHAYLREELPRLTELTQKVAQGHSDDDPRLVDVARVFSELAGELVPHQEKEEQRTFPEILAAEAGTGAGPERGELSELETEHERLGGLLAELNRLTDGYTPADWACNSTRAMLDGLARLEADTHRHVHAENYILFPRVAAE
jgi:regulator of cell morphogenesis and NO signaling